MCPLGVGSSYSTDTLKTGAAKLWILLVGVNKYLDPGLPSLRYPAVDCQGLGEALSKATEGFPNKQVIIHHDFATEPPTLAIVRGSLQKIVSQTQSQDSILLYFSGHGMLDPNNHQAVLCLADTRKDDLLTTGLALQELLQMLGNTDANQQLVCLDTCHSGDMKLFGINSGNSRNANISEPLLNTAPKLMEVLRQRAAQSKGFCALLSCDQGQQSWEFPELGHGVFTYYLMRGLLGEAADSSGVIEADGLYKYVYRQTLQYIDKLNQQLRLINQQKLKRGESKLYPEYPLQTPKRIVEGVGELILGFKSAQTEFHQQRRALVIDGLANQKITTNLSRTLVASGGFEVEFYPHKGKSHSDIRGTIQRFLRGNGELETPSQQELKIVKNTPTCLLYLRGYIDEIEDGEAWLILADGMRLSRSWLRQELRRATQIQQIIILDCPQATSLENWLEDLQSTTEHGQCIIAVASTANEPDFASYKLVEILVSANSQVGLPVTKLITELQNILPAKGIDIHTWLSGTHAVIDILPGNIGNVLQNSPELELPEIEKKQELTSLAYSANSPEECVPISVIPTEEFVDKQVQHQLILSGESEAYKKLETLLKQSLGKVAPTLLRRYFKKATNSEYLVQKLATFILPENQASFQIQATAILNELAISSSKKLDESPIIDDKFINECQRELAYAIGPIANYIVQKILQSHPQISLQEFVMQLAAEISDPQKALKFQQRMLKQ